MSRCVDKSEDVLTSKDTVQDLLAPRALCLDLMTVLSGATLNIQRLKVNNYSIKLFSVSIFMFNNLLPSSALSDGLRGPLFCWVGNGLSGKPLGILSCGRSVTILANSRFLWSRK